MDHELGDRCSEGVHNGDPGSVYSPVCQLRTEQITCQIPSDTAGDCGLMPQICQRDRLIDRVSAYVEFDPLCPENIFPMLVRLLPSCDTVDHRLSDAKNITGIIIIYVICLVCIPGHLFSPAVLFFPLYIAAPHIAISILIRDEGSVNGPWHSRLNDDKIVNKIVTSTRPPEAREVCMKERIYRIRAGIPNTIALLSDLHGKDGHEALEILRRRQPAMIAVTGDLFLGYKVEEGANLVDLQPKVLPFIQSCADLAPTYISLGNHEWLASPSDFRALKSTGAVLLDNEWVRDEKTGLAVGGLTSAMVMDYRRFRKKHTPDLRYPEEKRHIDGILLRPSDKWLRAFEAQDGYKILLCHHPEYWSLQTPWLMDHPIDLVLSGHAHGGQIRLFGRGLYSPGQGFLPRYTGGVFSGPHGNLVVSRGLANTAPRPIPRLFNPREVITIVLH